MATIAPSAPIERVLSRLSKVKGAGPRSWMACCPAHEDRTPSLSITEGADGRALLRCHAGCTFAAIVAALELTPSDLFPESARPTTNGVPAPDPSKRPTFVKSYDYVTADAQLLYQVCRFVDPEGKKTFRQRRPDDRGGWIWHLGETPLVLYRLPELVDAIEHGRPVFIVEGEKDADTLAEAGYAATTNARGAGKWREEYAATFKGATVVILPDNDDTGRSHAEQVAASCSAAGATTVKIVALPGLPPKGDVSDWMAAGRTLDEFDAAVTTTAPWIPPHLRQEKRTRWRLDELLDNDAVMRPPPPIVPRFAWAGRSTLVAAREKAGKSTLTGYITACVSTGRPFLEERCEQGDVLIVGLEEFIGDTARRLRHFKADPTRVHLVDRFAGEAALRPQELREHIEAVTPVLVIVDSLTAYANGQIQDDNNATQMAKVVQPLSDLVHQLGPALLLIHHATKATGRSRGSTAITAGVDVVVEFEAPDDLTDTDPTLRRVHSVGRVPVERQYDIRFDELSYALVDRRVDRQPLDVRIGSYVRNHPACSQTSVCDGVGGRASEARAQIQAMLLDGRLRNLGTLERMRLVVPGDDQGAFGYGGGE